MTADPNANYIEHCHWLLALPLSVTSTHSLSSRSGRVILSGWEKCDRVTETCLRGLFWKLSSGLRCNLYVKNVDNALVGA